MKEPKDLYFTLKDLYEAAKRHKKSIFWAGFLGGVFAFFLSVLFPLHYEAKATFQEMGSDALQSSAKIESLLLGSGKSNEISTTISTFTSHSLLKDAIKALHLQAEISKPPALPPTVLCILETLWTEKAYLFNHQPFAPYQDQESFYPSFVDYEGDEPLRFTLTFSSNDTFSLYDPKTGQTTTHKFDERIFLKEATFTLSEREKAKRTKSSYTLFIHPMRTLCASFAKNLKVEPDKKDHRLLTITFCHPKNWVAAAFVNQLIFSYIEKINMTNQSVIEGQVFYLNRKEKEMKKKLIEQIDDQAKGIAGDLATYGFLDSRQALEAFSMQYKEILKHLFQIDCSIKRLERAKEDPEQIELITVKEEKSPVLSWIYKLREIQKRKDNITLSIESFPKPFETPMTIETDLNELKRVSLIQEEAKELLVCLNKGDPLPLCENLIRDQNYPELPVWINIHEERGTLFREYFISYVKNLQQQLLLKEGSLKEKLNQREQGSDLYQGVTLETVDEVYIQLTKNYHALENQIDEISFALGKMENDMWNTSSLPPTALDPISQDILKKSHDLFMKIKDDSTRLTAERERLTEVLRLQLQFLKGHLSQLYEMSLMKKEVLLEKLQTLQRSRLSLLRQESSLLKGYLLGYIESKTDQLKQEKLFLLETKEKLQAEMSKLPERWTSEMLTHHELELNLQMLKELFKLAESKNLARHLETIRSQPLDLAEMALLPKNPRVLLLTLLGALSGFTFAGAFFMASSLKRGISVTENNLILSKFDLIGSLSSFASTASPSALMEEDLSAMRSIVSWIGKESSLALHIGEGTDYSRLLASLFVKQGKKPLILKLYPDNQDEEGLYSYFSGLCSSPKIASCEGFDEISLGSFDRHAIDAINEKNFPPFLKKMLQNYEIVLAVFRTRLLSGEMFLTSSLFPCSIITLQEGKNTLKEISLNEMQTKGRLGYIFEKSCPFD